MALSSVDSLTALRQAWKNFLTALAFLSRLGPATVCEVPQLQASVRWYPAAGVIIGLCCTLPPVLLLACFPHCSQWLCAWIYLALAFWITRGMHWDALADLGDAWGSGAQGERFRAILKDSRLGAAGALCLLCIFSLQLILVQELLRVHHWIPLLTAPAAGRALSILLCAWTPPYDPRSLGGCIRNGADRQTQILAASVLLLTALLLPLPAFPLLVITWSLLLWSLRRLALRHGGSNGDFLGSSILLGECLTFACGLC